MHSRSLLFRSELPTRPVRPLLSKGFRPFFLLAALFAALAVPLWLVALRGGVAPGGSLGALGWHAHEMVFGFATAVVAGFLLTAVGNWTNRETARGPWLAALAALWIAGRIALFFAARLPRGLPAAIDVLFLPALAVACARPIALARSRRNYAFVAMLLVLGACNLTMHLGALHQRWALLRVAQGVAIDCLVLMMVVVTGRVLPMFTRNATRDLSIHGSPRLELAAALGVLLVLVLDAAQASRWPLALAAGSAGALVLWRSRHWGMKRSFSQPLLWILHLGQLWLGVGLLLRAASALTPAVPAASALHALTAGALGALTLGMMARVSLGHTGRMLAASRWVHCAFWLVTLAALLRVLAPFAPATSYLVALWPAAICWSLAFGIFVLAHARMLSEPRVD